MDMTMIGLALLLTGAAYTDLRTMKISNKWVGFFLVAGLGMRFVLDGHIGAVIALTGALAGFMPFIILYRFGAVGAGDVKLFTAVGVWAGIWMTLYGAMYAVLFAGVAGCVVLVGSPQFWRGLVSFVRTRQGLWLPRQRFPFMLAVVPGMIAGWLHVTYW